MNKFETKSGRKVRLLIYYHVDRFLIFISNIFAIIYDIKLPKTGKCFGEGRQVSTQIGASNIALIMVVINQKSLYVYTCAVLKATRLAQHRCELCCKFMKLRLQSSARSLILVCTLSASEYPPSVTNQVMSMT